MGLDMYLYKLKKPDIKMGIYNWDDPVIDQLLQISQDEYEQEMYAQIHPFCTRIFVKREDYDYEKIAADYDMKMPIRISGFGTGGCTFTDDVSHVSILPEDIKKYQKPFMQTMYVADKEQVYYWRKAYDVQSMLYNKMECEIENCGFYLLTEELAEEIAKIDAEFDTSIVSDDRANIFYHEWY